jgi:peptide/nickel transport system permease protein
MVVYIIKRVLMFIPILLGISLVCLVFIDIAPGDPAEIIVPIDNKDGKRAEKVQAVREELGLNDSFVVRYVRFIGNVLKGDLGNDYFTKRPVGPDIMNRFPYTLTIATLSVLISVVIGIPTGIFAATHQYSWKDNTAIILSLVFVSMPSFWFALLLVRLFSVQLGWLPVSGIKNWTGWILPSLSLALSTAAGFARQARSNMLEVIRQDYITTARAKGQNETVIRYRHALKNAGIPLIMLIGGLFGMQLGGALIAEVVFSIPGLGQYTLTGLTNRNYPVIQASVLFISSIYCVIILLIDILFAFIDPRIRSAYVKPKRLKAKEAA